MDPENVDNTVLEDATPPVADNPVVDPPSADNPPAAGDPPPPAPEPTPAKPAVPKPAPWYLDKLASEATRAQQALARAEAAERRANEAEARAAALAAGKDPATPPNPQPPASQDARRAEIQVEAARQRFAEDTQEVVNKGRAEYGASFTEAVNVLNAVVGAGPSLDEFVADVLAVDKAGAHSIFKQLGEDAEKTAVLAGMTSRQRIAELTRMTIAKAAPKPDPAPAANALAPVTKPAAVSKAPPPAPRLTPGTSKPPIDGYSDEATDEQFTAQFTERWAKRRANR